jgi:hypothetical protein
LKVLFKIKKIIMQNFIYILLFALLVACTKNDNEQVDDNDTIIQDDNDTLNTDTTITDSIVTDTADIDDSQTDTTGLQFDIWQGAKIIFTKSTGADPTLKANQDSITPSVSITRGNSGGEIYNIIEESQSSKGSSPSGTEWAIGEVSEIENLNFASFRSAVGSPRQVVGKSLVLHIIKEDVYLSVEFKSWGQGQNGDFSYERSTQN